MKREKKNKIIKFILLVLISIVCIIVALGLINSIKIDILEWWFYDKGSDGILSMLIGKTIIILTMIFKFIAMITLILVPFGLPWKNKKKGEKKNGRNK